MAWAPPEAQEFEPPEKGLLDSAVSLGNRLGYGAALGTIGVAKAKTTLIDRPIYAAIKAFTGQDVSSLADEQIAAFAPAEQNISRLSQAEGGGVAGSVAETVGSAIPALAAQIPAAGSAFLLSGGNPSAGIWASSIIGGAQSGASTYEDAKSAYMAEGLSPEEASQKAVVPSILSAASTAIVTRAFGATGIDKIFKLEGPEAVKTALVKTLVKEGVAEGAEEAIDQAVQSAIQKTTYNPNLTLEDAVKQTLLAGAAGSIIGGGVATTFHAIQARREAAQTAEAVGPATASVVDQSQQVSPEITAKVNELRAAREAQPLTPEPTNVTPQAEASATETPPSTEVLPTQGEGNVAPLESGIGQPEALGAQPRVVPTEDVLQEDARDTIRRLRSGGMSLEEAVAERQRLATAARKRVRDSLNVGDRVSIEEDEALQDENGNLLKDENGKQRYKKVIRVLRVDEENGRRFLTDISDEESPSPPNRLNDGGGLEVDSAMPGHNDIAGGVITPAPVKKKRRNIATSTPLPDFASILPDSGDIPTYLANAWQGADANVPLEFTAIEPITGSGGLGLYTSPNEDGTSTLQIDPQEIQNHGESQERITRALAEEAIHAQDIKALHRAWQAEGSDKPFLTHLEDFWTQVADEMTPAQKELVNRTYHGNEKYEAGTRLDPKLEGAEFLRMLLQEDITGTLSEGSKLGITRDQLAPTTALGRILRTIQKFLDPNVALNPLAAKHFDRVKALIGEKAAPTKPFSPENIPGLKYNGPMDNLHLFTEEDPNSPAKGGTFAVEGEPTPEKIQAAREVQNQRFTPEEPVVKESLSTESTPEASPQMREKSFIARQRANSYVEDALNISGKIDPYYEVLPNKVLFDRAKEANTSDPNALATILDPKSDVAAPDRVARGIDLYETYFQAAKKAEADGDIEAANQLTDQAVAIADALDEQMGREYGRAIQAMRGRMTPRGWERYYARGIRKATEPLRKSIQPELDELQTTVEEAKQELPKKASYKKTVKGILDSVKGLAASAVGANIASKPEDGSLVDLVAKIGTESKGDIKIISERLVNEAGMSKSKADAIAGRLVEAAKAEIAQKTQAYLGRLVKNAGKKKVARAMKSSMDKIIDLSLKGGLTQEAVWNAVSEKLGLPAYDPATAREIQRKAEAIQSDPKNQVSPIAKGRAVHDLANFIAQKTGVDGLDILKSYWYAAVLSGMGTQATNFLNTISRTASELGITAFDQAAIKGDPQAAVQAIKGYLSGFAKSIPAFNDALFKGDFTGQYSFEAQRAANALEQIPEDASKALQLVSKAKYVSRLMAAVDIFNATAAAESRARLRAYQEFKRLNVPAEKINDAIEKALGSTPEQLKSAQIQAEAEGFKGDEAKRRVTEILEQQRPSSWTEDARSYGLSSTFNDPKPKGVIGMFATGIEQMFNAMERKGRESGRVEAKLAAQLPRLVMMPFIRIVANVTNDYINYTPLAGYRFFRAKNFLGPSATENDVRLLQGKILAGNMLLMAVAARLAFEDLKDEKDRKWDLVGNGPKDPDQRKQWMAAGNKPWSIVINGKDGKKTNLPYIYTPAGMAFAMLGSYRDAQKYATEKDPSLTMKLAGAAMNGAFVINDMSFLQGVTNVLDLLDKNQSPESFARKLAGTPAKIVSGLNPNILKEITTYFSPEVPDTKTAPLEIAAIFGKDWPVLRQTVSGKPQLNILGEKVEVYKYPWSRFWEQKTPSEQWNLLGQLQERDVFVPFASYQNKVDPKTGARDKRMTGAELYDFYKARGENLKERLSPDVLRVLIQLSNENPERAQDELNSIVRDASDQAKGELGF